MTQVEKQSGENLSRPPHIKVLLVEDSIADAMLLTTFLKERCPHAHVDVVQDGEEASQYLSSRSKNDEGSLPEIILLDLNLPKKSGFEVLAELRAEPKMRHIPVFVLSTSSSTEDKDRAGALGVMGFFTKPADLHDIENLTYRLCDVEIPRALNGRADTVNATQQADLPFSTSSASRTEITAEAFRLLVDAVKDYAIFMLDPRGYVLTWNQGAQKIKQYLPAEIIGRHFSVFYPQEVVRRKHPEYELRVAEKEGRYEEEGWRLRKDGSLFWASVTLTAIRRKNGELVGFGKVTRDMTERKQTEERLRNSEERFRLLVEGVRDYAIFMLDPLGHVISWNKGAERIKGYKASEILGKHVSTFYPQAAKDQNHAEHELDVALKKGSYEEEGIRVRKDGTTFWANVVITPVYDSAGKHTGYAKITRDITERKRAEEEIRNLNQDLERRVQLRTQELEESKNRLEAQKEELLRSNTDLQRFAYIASHDLQEPLRIIISYLQMLQRRAGKNLDADSLKYIEFAVTSAARMRHLVEDLLSYARVESEKESFAPVNFKDVVQTALENLADRIIESQAQITVGHLPIAPANCQQMIRVFQNLIVNAILYRSPERKLEIEIGSDETAQEYTFWVKDNGIGIKSEYHQKIFEIFQRLHGDRENIRGTGMGLAICKRIVERHNGRIWVESEPGVGSKFLFSIPKSSP